MTRRTKIIIAVVVLLLIAILLALLLLRREPAAPVVETSRPAVTSPVTGLPVSEPAAAPAETPAETPALPPVQPQVQAPVDDTASIKRLAAAFAERFGSFSNQSDFDNIEDLKVFMTAEMSAWADGYVAEQRSQGTSTVFSGTTTRAISSELTAFDEAAGTAAVTVGTQRRETKGGVAEARVYYQDMELGFVKIGSQWKVNSASWK